MEGELRHFIGGTLVEEPGGWQDFKEEIERDLSDRIIYPKYPVSLRFVGDGYSLLRDAFEQSYCTSFDYLVEILCPGGWRPAASGVIYLTDIKWNLSKCIADTPITDSTVGAMILNNKDIPVYPSAELSKNAVAITPVSAIPLLVFDPNAVVGTYLPDVRIAYDWKDAMNHLVQFITDGQVTVESDWYDRRGTRYAMLTGLNLRTFGGGDIAPQFNFKDLYAAMWKPFNLFAGLVYDGTGSPVIRIEEEGYWFGNPGTIVFPHTEDLTQEIDTERMYAKIQAGSQNAVKNEDNDPIYSLPYLIMRTFSNEEYPVKGQCNTNTALDLRNPFVVCTNAIEDACINGDDKNDDEVFMIEYDPITFEAVKADYLTNAGVPYLYNEDLQNQLVVNRWNLQASGVNYVGSLSPGFLAEHTTGALVSGAFAVPLPLGSTASYAGPSLTFDDDSTPPNNDVDGNWDTALNRYTAPTQGMYIFNVTMGFGIFAPPQALNEIRIRLVFNHYDSGGTLLTFSEQVTPYTTNPLPSYSLSNTNGFIMNTGDYATVTMFYDLRRTWSFSIPSDTRVQPILFNNYTIGTSFVAQGGGQFEEVDPDDYYATKLTFSRHIDTETWAGLRDDYTQAIGVSPDASTLRNGYIRSASRTVYNGETEWELLANRQGRI